MAAPRYVVIVLLFAHALAAQQTGDLTLGGSVVNAKTGEPIARALVEITQVDGVRVANDRVRAGGERTAPHSRSTFTDSGGVFRFSGLPAGRYSIHASKPQFLDSGIARTWQPFVELSASITTQRIELAPLGVITGKIVDQEGMPASGVNVICLGTQILNGMMQLHGDRGVVTDDRGVFRFWNLTPGKYYVKANGSSGGTAAYEGNAPALAADEAIQPVYFGGGSTLEGAAPVIVTAGAAVQADFQVEIKAAFKVRGTLRNFVRGRPIKFELLTGPDDVLPARVTLNNSTGRFEVDAFVPGDYMLRASQDDNTGEMPIQLRNTNLDGVEISLAPPVSIPVNVQVPNSTANAGRNNPEPDGDFGRLSTEGTCTAVLYPAGRLYDQRFSYGKRAAKTANGEMTITGLVPGKYRVRADCYGAWVRSAVWGSQDLGRDDVITIAPFSSPVPIQILASTGGGEVKGKFTAAAGGPLTVIFVPQFATAAAVLRAVLNPAEAEFEQAHLAPGDYMVWALADAAGSELEYSNPAVLKKLAGGVRVHVAEDASQEITIENIVREVEGNSN